MVAGFGGGEFEGAGCEGVVFLSGEVAASEGFSSEEEEGGTGDAVADRSGSHFLAIFFSTSRIRRSMSRAMRPNAMAKTA